MSLLPALIRASRKHLAPIARDYAAGNRPFLVELRRPGTAGQPVWDNVNKVMVNPTDPSIYTGPARIHLASNDALIAVGDEEMPVITTMVSINAFGPDTESDPEDAPRVDDVFHVVDEGESRAAHLAGRTFEVIGVERGGHFDIGWRLMVTGTMPSRSSG